MTAPSSSSSCSTLSNKTPSSVGGSRVAPLQPDALDVATNTHRQYSYPTPPKPICSSSSSSSPPFLNTCWNNTVMWSSGDTHVSATDVAMMDNNSDDEQQHRTPQHAATTTWDGPGHTLFMQGDQRATWRERSSAGASPMSTPPPPPPTSVSSAMAASFSEDPWSIAHRIPRKEGAGGAVGEKMVKEIQSMN
eukprot:PhM_4_TR9284/c0_g1_i1/m.31776